jgi:PfaD family protein
MSSDVVSFWRNCLGDFRRELWIDGVGSEALRVSFSGNGEAPAGVVRLPGIHPEWLGGGRFRTAHAVDFPYIVGEMARGIATTRMVISAVRAGYMGFFGSAGLHLEQVRGAVSEIKAALPSRESAWGTNLIHAPDDPAAEEAFMDAMLQLDVRRVSASAFMRLSPAIVRYSASGLSEGHDGQVVRRNHVFAKISRVEVATDFMRPAPEDVLVSLERAGAITTREAELARRLPVASDITVEGDSGGHTDNRPLIALFPLIARTLTRLWPGAPDWQRPRVGAAGGLGSPAGVAAAFQLGAEYVVTGSVNQCAVESGMSEAGRKLLATADLTDMAMAPAPDMFERGVKVQVLKRGTMFAARANRLYELYRSATSFEALPASDRHWLEAKVLGESFEAAWGSTRDYLLQNNPELLALAESDPHRQLALVFRRYLFFGAQWAREGRVARSVDFQIWSGPAIGDFNDWVRGTALEPLTMRNVADIGKALLEGACRHQRGAQMRALGIAVPWDAMDDFVPVRNT